MGNWRTVYITGFVSPDDLPALRKACEWNIDDPSTFGNMHALSNTHGVFGLGDWPQELINAVGNLAERGYSVENVANTLRNLVKISPSLTVKVHCGGDFEDRQCVATIVVDHGGVAIVSPEIDTLPEISTDKVIGQMMSHLFLR